MNPITHGEVFVTDDGGETDMDIGAYERFLDKNLSKLHNITTGQVYRSVIEGERLGEYLGKCVQIIPHITDQIKACIRQAAEEEFPDKIRADICLVEVGGTVGDIESMPFLEAIRQMRKDAGRDNVLYIHVTLLPYLNSTQELKTKPTQHSVNELRRIGIQPDLGNDFSDHFPDPPGGTSRSETTAPVQPQLVRTFWIKRTSSPTFLNVKVCSTSSPASTLPKSWGTIFCLARSACFLEPKTPKHSVHSRS
jgi:hypothetical protein